MCYIINYKRKTNKTKIKLKIKAIKRRNGKKVYTSKSKAPKIDFDHSPLSIYS